MTLEVSTGTVSQTDAVALSEYVRAFPRGFVKGDSYADGEVDSQDVNAEGVLFAPVGSSLELRRLVRETSDGEAVFGYGGFDTTGRRLHTRLPEGYSPAAPGYVLFQWLDDDRFAVMAGVAHNEFGWNAFSGYGDILVCDIAQERCTLAAPGPRDDVYRIVPHMDGRPELTQCPEAEGVRSAGDGATRGGHQPLGVGAVRGRLGRRLDQARLRTASQTPVRPHGGLARSSRRSGLRRRSHVLVGRRAG